MKVEIGTNEAGQRLDKFLRKWLKEIPLSAIFKAIRKGDVRVNTIKVKGDYNIQLGDIIETKDLERGEKKEKFVRIENSLKIIFEDHNILMVEKWPGVLVHSDSNKLDDTLTDYVLSYLYDKGQYEPEKEISFTPSPCNRLDRNTSGIVIYAKNYEALKSVNEMIRDRKINKFYMALVKGKVKDGIYNAFISKSDDSNISKVSKDFLEGYKQIAMEVKSIQTCGTFSLVELELITGRSHQLRAHLSFLGNPIIGDKKYGEKKLNSFFENKYNLSYQYLYAYRVEFKDCPPSLDYLENKVITEALPPIFKKIKRDTFRF
ncbi:MAG TPA: RluA family pseudouridine synthase [Clostridiaceae bacterium]